MDGDERAPSLAFSGARPQTMFGTLLRGSQTPPRSHLTGPVGADGGGRRQLPGGMREETGERPGHQGALAHQAVQVEETLAPAPPDSRLDLLGPQIDKK